jgi:hypothetical protein
MNTKPRVRDIDLKVERAKHHIRQLDIAIRRFDKSEPYTLSIQHKPNIGHVALYVASLEPVPEYIALIIGDAVHNFRSALDHLAWQLVEAGGGVPDKDTYFPICQNAQQYASAVGKGEIKKIPVGTKEALSAVQPYICGNDTLWHIHELDRIDKHRLLITTTTAIKKWSIVIDPSIGREIGWEEPLRTLKVGDEIVNVPEDTYHRTGHKNFKLGINVAFGQTEILAGKPVLETLHQMFDFITCVVAKFEPHLI